MGVGGAGVGVRGTGVAVAGAAVGVGVGVGGTAVGVGVAVGRTGVGVAVGDGVGVAVGRTAVGVAVGVAVGCDDPLPDPHAMVRLNSQVVDVIRRADLNRVMLPSPVREGPPTAARRGLTCGMTVAGRSLGSGWQR